MLLDCIIRAPQIRHPSTEAQRRIGAALAIITAMFHDVHIPLMVPIGSLSLNKSEVLPQLPKLLQAMRLNSTHKSINYAGNISHLLILRL